MTQKEIDQRVITGKLWVRWSETRSALNGRPCLKLTQPTPSNMRMVVMVGCGVLSQTDIWLHEHWLQAGQVLWLAEPTAWVVMGFHWQTGTKGEEGLMVVLQMNRTPYERKEWPLGEVLRKAYLLD